MHVVAAAAAAAAVPHQLSNYTRSDVISSTAARRVCLSVCLLIAAVDAHHRYSGVDCNTACVQIEIKINTIPKEKAKTEYTCTSMDLTELLELSSSVRLAPWASIP